MTLILSTDPLTFIRENRLSLRVSRDRGSLSPRRLSRNPKSRARVILSPSEGSAFVRTRVESALVFRNYKTKKQILRRSTPQNDIATQPLEGEEVLDSREVRLLISGCCPTTPLSVANQRWFAASNLCRICVTSHRSQTPIARFATLRPGYSSSDLPNADFQHRSYTSPRYPKAARQTSRSESQP